MGDGHPVLLINGIGAHLDMWAPLERTLPGMRLIAFDAPGTGRSSTSYTPLSLELLSELTEQLLDRVLALVGSPGSLGWLHELTCETLVVAGDDDP